MVKKAKKLDMNISSFLKIRLQEYMALMSIEDGTLRGRFELPIPRWRTGSQGRRGRPSFATSAVLKLICEFKYNKKSF